MKVMFVDQTVKTCSIPTEQKVFRSGAPAGWIVVFQLTGAITSEELDKLTTAENLETLTFQDDDGSTLFELVGYTKMSSAVIKHGQTAESTVTELQFTKGV